MVKLNVAQVVEPAKVEAIARDIRNAGGRALIIGGFVRDHFLELPSKDIDIEVFGLLPEVLEAVLERHGEVMHMGRAFGIIQVKGLSIDFSLPRRDSKTGSGHTGFDVELDPFMDHTEASRRRDLTISCMGWDPLTGELLDPFGGQEDIKAGDLRAIDQDMFLEDPLRVLRVAQFSARFQMDPVPELVVLCQKADLSELSAERVLEEFRKLLLRGVEPSRGLNFLKKAQLLKFFPELDALYGCEQDPEWHPEGDVWTHTCMVVDAAAKLRDEVEDKEALMFGALCHDLGKPSTSEFADGHLRSHGHDSAGVPLAETFLERMRASKAVVKTVSFLVGNHLSVGSLVNSPHTTAKAYRRLARKADEAGTNLKLLEVLCRSDRLGTTTEKALTVGFPEGAVFLERARELKVEEKVPPPVVMGRHLIARDMKPGPEFGTILAQCRDIQDEHGWEDPDRILDVVLNP
jgi:tRNA nucleotidyltransferase (CCA-adding enzyme)